MKTDTMTRFRAILAVTLVFCLGLPALSWGAGAPQLMAQEQEITAVDNTNESEATETVGGEEASEEDGEETVGPLSMDLTLEEALELVMEDSLQLELAELNLDKAAFLEDRDRRRARNIDSVFTYDAALAKELVPRSALMGLRLAEKEREMIDNVIQMNTERAYIDLLKAQQDLANGKRALERAREQLRITRVSYEAGVVARGDLVGAQAAAASSEASLSGLASRHQSAMLRMADTLNLPLDTEIRAVSRFAYEPADIDVDKAVREALTDDIAVLAAREALALRELQFDIARRYYTPNTYIYKEDNFNLQQSKLELEETKKGLEGNVRNAWYNMLAAESGYLALREGLAFSRENYRIAQLRYQEGMATRFEVEEAEGRLSEQEKDVSQMLYTYNLARAQFRYAIYGSGS